MIDDLLRLDAKSQESGTDTTRSKKTVSSFVFYFFNKYELSQASHKSSVVISPSLFVARVTCVI